MRYYISDLHFYHNNLNTQLDYRGFETVEEMNEYMISQWNKKVRKNDDVVVLGDFSMGNVEETNRILDRLQGKIYLILGNHDRVAASPGFKKERFVWIKDYAQMKDNKRKVVLSHYPIFCYNGQYRRDKNDVPLTYMLYGHVHDSQDEKLVQNFKKITRETLFQSKHDKEPRKIPCQMLNCFCMYSDYVPLSLDEWIELHKERGTY